MKSWKEMIITTILLILQLLGSLDATGVNQVFRILSHNLFPMKFFCGITGGKVIPRNRCRYGRIQFPLALHVVAQVLGRK